jgi:hypothetical protein
MPMPVIINPKNTGEYRKERERENAKKPEITSARWGKGQLKEGEDVEITAQVKEIEDGNVMTFQMWKEGQDPAAHVAFDRINAVIEGGAAEGKWKPPVINGNELPPENDPKYFLTVHSAWCPMKKSECMTVELKRPEITDIKWEVVTYDGKGNENGSKTCDELEYKKEAIVCIKTKDLENGEYINVTVFDETNNDLKNESIMVEGGECRLRCKIAPKQDILEALKKGEQLRYCCSAKPSRRGKQKKGPSLKIIFTFVFNVGYLDETEDLTGKYILESADGSYKQSKTKKDDKRTGNNELTLEFTNVEPGLEYSLYYTSDNKYKNFQFKEIPFYVMLNS